MAVHATMEKYEERFSTLSVSRGYKREEVQSLVEADLNFSTVFLRVAGGDVTGTQCLAV
jgi:hypothetical protein